MTDEQQSAAGWRERLLHCYFMALDVLLERKLVEHCLEESFEAFKRAGEPYPFVTAAELKPGSVTPSREHPSFNTTLLLLLRDELPESLKPHIRARRCNEILQRNLQKFVSLPMQAWTDLGLLRDLRSERGLNELTVLLQLDYALLIQRKRARKDGLCYSLTNFHVKIDEVLDRIIEKFARELRYVSKSLYERGEEYASLLEEKFFELHGMKSTAAGRRTAAIVAHRLLLEHGVRHRVYVASSETRSLFKYGEGRGFSRFCLVELTKEDLAEIASRAGLSVSKLRNSYTWSGKGNRAALLRVDYAPTPPALPPDDARKLRKECNPLERWLSISSQYLLPVEKEDGLPPLRISWVYKTGKG